MATNSKSGPNSISGGNGNDHINGGSGHDLILGLGGNDRINAGSGNDTMDGGAGNDIVNGDAGDDLGIYVLGENAGSTDVYDGGSGIDTLQLVMTRAEWMSPTVQADIARYLAFLAEVIHPVNGQAKNTNFTFSFGLTVSKFENLGVIVDGVAFDPRDQAVTLVNDVMAAGEDTVSVAVNVLANDSVPDLIATLTHTSPAHGSVTLTRTNGAPGAADTASFVYAPDSAYWQFLAAGQTATDSFTYTVTDADGDTRTATVTVTITGANDAPTITAAVSTGAAFEDGTVAAAGTVDFADVDLRDGHSVTSTADGEGYLGVFTTTVADDGAGDGAGSLNWDFAVDNAAIQYLAAGETLTQTYTVTVDDGQGGTVSQPITVTITGANDGPVIIAADTSGSVSETSPVTAPGAASTPVLLEVEANDTFGTAQLIDRALLRIAPNVNLGDAGDPSISVSGSVAVPGAQDVFRIDLAAGELITLDIDFASGFGTGRFPGYPTNFGLDSFVFIYDSAGNLLNFNDDAPRGIGGAGSVFGQDSYLQFSAVSDGVYYIVVKNWDGDGARSAGPYTLQVSVDSQNLQLTDTGSIAFTDIDLADVHSVGVAAQGPDYLGALTAVVSNDTTGGGAGEIDWTFSVANAAVQFLGVGETLTQTYSVTVNDGQGGTASRDVTVTIVGENDAPVITTAFSAGTAVEDAGNGATGVISFDDVDLIDSHSVTSTADGIGYRGVFSAVINDDATGAGAGEVTWTFAASEAELQFLAAGQTLLQRYTITLSDGNGGTTQQLVNITIVGSNDAPVISGGVSNGGVVEDGVTTAAGSVDFGDVDLRDSHTAVSSADGAGYIGTFTAVLTDDGANDGAGSVSWNFAVDNAAIQHMGAGEVLTQTYTITVSDGQGGTVSQPVTVTIAGANDGPVAAADSFSTGEDGSLTLTAADVTANDSDIDGDTLTIVAVDGSASLGTVQLVGGQIVYSPGSAFQTLRTGETGLDRFSYTVTDPSGATATATVEVVINGANDAPTAGDDSAFANAGGSVIVDVLANDSDPEGDALTIDSIGAAGHGTVVLNADGTVTYTPAAGYSGGDAFSYTVRDASGAIDTATVSLVVGLSDHDTVGGDVFLQGNFMEIGVSRSGSLGTASAAPSNYHPQGRSNISYVVDTDGWTSGGPPRAGDFTLPGSPVDSIVLGFNGVSYAQDERSGRRDINTTTTDVSSGGLLGAQTVGVAGGAVRLTQTITLDPGATYYTTTITVTNVSSATVNDVRFLRSFDPDQDQFRYGNFTTRNDVLSNPSAGNDLAVARALGPNSGVSVNLVSFDGDARASNYGFANYNAYASQAYNSPVDLNGQLVDQAITMAFNFGNLGAGQTLTKVFYTSLNGSSQANDMLVGGTGVDVLDSGAGNDFVIGLTGDDQLTGGTGDDQFVFTRGSGRDVITDFTAGAGTDDVLEVRGFGFTDLAGIRAVSSQVGADVLINLSATDSVTLRGVQLADLSADDFLFDAAPPAAAAMASAGEKGGFEVLPGADEDDFLVMAKDFGEPATLPGAMDAGLLLSDEGGPTFGGGSDDLWMLTLLPAVGELDSGEFFAGGSLHPKDDLWL